MDLIVDRVEPSDKYLKPALEIRVKIKIDNCEKSAITLGGRLESGGKIISNLENWSQKGQDGEQFQKSSLEASLRGFEVNRNGDEGAEEFTTAVYAPLGAESVNYIEKNRRQSEKGHVHLDVLLELATIKNEIEIRTVAEEYPPDIGIDDQNGKKILATDRSSNAKKDLDILTSSDAPEYISVGRTVLQDSKQISSNDWITDYAPDLGVGERLVVELPDPSSSTTDSLSDAIAELHKARGMLREGKWRSCMGVLDTEVLELIDPNKGEEDLWELQDTNYNQNAESKLNASASTLRDFAGKFRHSRDKSDEKMGDTEPLREDAYFFYATTASLIQLLAKKQDRKLE